MKRAFNLVMCLCLPAVENSSNKCFSLVSYWLHIWSLLTGACRTTDSKATERTTERQQEQGPQNCTEGWNQSEYLRYLNFNFRIQFTLPVRNFLNLTFCWITRNVVFFANILTLDNIKKKLSLVNLDLPVTSYFNWNDLNRYHSCKKKPVTDNKFVSQLMVAGIYK